MPLRTVVVMPGPLSSPTAPPTGELLLTGALLSVYLGLRAASAALAIPGSLSAARGMSLRARP